MNLFDFIKHEDPKLISLMRKLEDTSAGTPDARRRLRSEALVRTRWLHRVEYDNLVPALRVETSTWGMAEEIRRYHWDVEQLLREMELLPVDDPAFERQIERLSGLLRTYVEWKEHVLLPRTQKVLLPEEADAMGERAEQARLELQRKLEQLR